MENPLAPTTSDSKSQKEVSSVAGHEDQEAEAKSYPTAHQVGVDIQEEEEEEEEEESRRVESETIQRRPILYRVPALLRENKKHLYKPIVLALGPYHDHSESQFQQVEEVKDQVLNHFINSTLASRGKDKEFFIGRITERIDEIRTFFGGVSIDEYNNRHLAEMMLRDGFFILFYMDMLVSDDADGDRVLLLQRRLGWSVGVFLYRDMLMLENQIPFWLIKMLITLTDEDKDKKMEALVCKCLSWMTFQDTHKLRIVPWEPREEPLHLLEAYRATLLFREVETSSSTIHATKVLSAIFGFKGRLRKSCKSFLTKCGWRKSSGNSSTFESANGPFGSVTHLKAKGIYFAPSSYCLKDIRFDSYWFYGKLYLPIRYVSDATDVLFSNVIAFETSPEITISTDDAMRSYVNFMNSLIDKPEDVKELREKGILLSNLWNDEEVMKVMKEIHTYGDFGNFEDIKMKINKHCMNKGKTWMVELFHTYFRSPWTIIAVLYAVFLLCLTFLQTYYTMYPRN